MATALRMPDMGTVEGTVTLLRWLKAEGETVSLGEPLFEAETDKGVSEVEAAIAGVLEKKLVQAGGRVGAGEPIALIRRPGEATEVEAAIAAAAPAAAVAPVIRALAEKHGVDLATVQGTGPGGRVTRQDVLAVKAVSGSKKAATHDAPSGKAPDAARPLPRSGMPPAASPAPLPSSPAGLSHSQSIVAHKVSQSHREKPVYHVQARVDMSAVIRAREAAKSRGQVLSWDAFLLRACAKAVTELPVFRRWMNAEEVAEHPEADVAVAVAVGEDLYVPAVRRAAERSLISISADIAELTRRAQARTLSPRDIEGSCFLVSNLGMFGVDSFDAIVYPEHSAALAVGAVTPTPVSDGVRTWIAPLAHLTLTVDHRLINGRIAAQFMCRVKAILESGAGE